MAVFFGMPPPRSVGAKCEEQGSTDDELVALVFRHLEREWQLHSGRLLLERGRQVHRSWCSDTSRGVAASIGTPPPRAWALSPPVVSVFRHLKREWKLPSGHLLLERGHQVRTTGFSQLSTPLPLGEDEASDAP